MKYIINIQSFTDIITNSSSELFVFDDNKNQEHIRELIIKYLNLLRECGEEIDPIDDMMTIYEANLGTIKSYSKSWNISIPENALIITSTNDNSIPWNVQEFIQDTLGAERYHLG